MAGEQLCLKFLLQEIMPYQLNCVGQKRKIKNYSSYSHFSVHSPSLTVALWYHMLSGSWSTLVQVMVWGLFVNKPSPEQILTYCQMAPKQWTSVNVTRNEGQFHKKKKHLEMWFLQWQPFYLGPSVLMYHGFCSIMENIHLHESIYVFMLCDVSCYILWLIQYVLHWCM